MALEIEHNRQILEESWQLQEKSRLGWASHFRGAFGLQADQSALYEVIKTLTGNLVFLVWSFKRQRSAALMAKRQQ